MGANVHGYALAPDTHPSFYALTRLKGRLHSTIADVRDLERVRSSIAAAKPEVVFHLAAQPLVRRSYAAPLDTFAINVIGTANVLEALRNTPSVKAVVVVTSDKCYANDESSVAYREGDPLGGKDPYSASKACAELVCEAYRRSFFQNPTNPIALATARAGNVIGGGDWSHDRIMADAVRAFASGEALCVRNPSSVRPWQHVLEPIAGYLMLAERLCRDGQQFSGAWNFGPNDDANVQVSALADQAARQWSNGARWQAQNSNGDAPEAHLLRIDSTKARQLLGWKPVLSLDDSIRLTIEWYRHALSSPDTDMYDETRAQIRAYSDKLLSRPETRPPL